MNFGPQGLVSHTGCSHGRVLPRIRLIFLSHDMEWVTQAGHTVVWPMLGNFFDPTQACLSSTQPCLLCFWNWKWATQPAHTTVYLSHMGVSVNHTVVSLLLSKLTVSYMVVYLNHTSVSLNHTVMYPVTWSGSFHTTVWSYFCSFSTFLQIVLF